MIGRILSHYRVTQKLGEGGMGEVYAAEDTTLKRLVALKLLPADLASDTNHRKRFRQEALAAAALNHPNIVTLHAVEEVDGLDFLVMELVEGRSLADLISPKGLPLRQLFDIGIPLADALGAAHDHGVVHRDLKPGNIMVTEKGVPKILDFGVARLRPAERRLSNTQMTTEALSTGWGLQGTVPYMSPEQVRGTDVDERSDIFSFGIILYQLATGQRPFTGETSADVISAILHQTPRPADELRPELPRHLGRIIRQCLVKDRERRLQSAKDLRNDLQDLKTEVTTGATGVTRPAPRPGRRRTIWLVGLAILLLVTAATWHWSRQRESVRPLRPEARQLLDEGHHFELRGYTRSDLAEAEHRYRRALDLDPAQPLIQARLAAHLARIQMRYATSERQLEIERLTAEALDGDSDLAPAHVARGILALLRGDSAAAEAAARHAVEAAPEDYSGYSLLGRALIGQSRIDEALSQLREAVSLAGLDPRARLTLASELSQLGHYDEAAVQYKEVLRNAPDSAQALNNLGIIYGRSGRYLEALPLLKHLLELGDNESAAVNLGMCYARLDRLDEAIEAFLEAHRMAPKKPDAPHSLGDAYERLGDLAAARGWYEKAVERYDLDLDAGGPRARSLGQRAVCVAKLGLFDEALENIREALALAPNNGNRLFNAAEVFALAGDREAAYAHVGRALEADYPRQEFERDLCFRPYRDDPRFRKLIEGLNAAVPDL